MFLGIHFEWFCRFMVLREVRYDGLEDPSDGLLLV